MFSRCSGKAYAAEAFPPSTLMKPHPISFVSATLALTLTVVVSVAKEPAFDYYVPLKPENVSLGHFPFDKAPILTVKSGAVVKIDGGGGSRWGDGVPNDWLKENNVKATLENTPALAETALILKQVKPPTGVAGGHMLVGPIAVEGAEPGIPSKCAFSTSLPVFLMARFPRFQVAAACPIWFHDLSLRLCIST